MRTIINFSFITLFGCALFLKINDGAWFFYLMPVVSWNQSEINSTAIFFFFHLLAVKRNPSCLVARSPRFQFHVCHNRRAVSSHRMPLRWSNACTMELGCSDISATSSCRTSIRLSSWRAQNAHTHIVTDISTMHRHTLAQKLQLIWLTLCITYNNQTS